MRKQQIIIITLVSMFLIITGCGTGENNTATNNQELIFTEADVKKEVISGTNEVGFQLLNEFKNETENVMVSPLSISLALAMTVNGADQETKSAILDAMQQKAIELEVVNESFQALLNLMQNSDPKVQLSVANSLWGREDKNFFEEFVTVNEQYYDAKLSLLDFQAADASKTINGWVKESTKSKIEEIVPEEIDPNTVMYLINAIYFKGDWQKPFNESMTRLKEFYEENGSKSKIKMMSTDGDFEYFETRQMQAIRLPYGDGRFSMNIILPDKTINLNELLDGLTNDQWQQWLDAFEKKQGLLQLPRFTLDYEKSLVEVLKKLGMEVAFDMHNANFSKIAPVPPNLYISEVLHKTFIEVNEKGTEAAAATSVEVKEESAEIYDFEMEVNRPFLFVIEDTVTGTILFIGVIKEAPTSF